MRFWTFGGLTFGELAKQIWDDFFRDDIMGQSAKLAFYFLLALFPLLIFFTALLGLFAQSPGLREDLLAYLENVAPPAAYELIYNTLLQITEGASARLLSFSILAALWAASTGMLAVMDSLNRAYAVEDSRPWWKARLVAIGITLAYSVAVIVALVLVLYGASIGNLLASVLGLEDEFTFVWNIGRWPVVLALVILALDLLYRYAPDLDDSNFQYLTPGAVLALALWLLASMGFRLYIAFFGEFNATYGSLGAVIILMLWFYLTGMAILMGAEVNSVIEKAAAEHGDREARLPGEKYPGERRAA
ncbi:MAG: YihY/virulence factor BrkB family protein [Bryobacteraceae bacterium]